MSDSLVILRKRRGFRRGQLTKLKRQLDETTSEDLRGQDLDTLCSLQIAIDEEHTLHQELQTRIEELFALEEKDRPEPTEDATAFTRELESGAEYKKLHLSYLATANSLIKDFKLYREFEELDQACTEWASSADPSSRTFVEESKEFVCKLDDYLSRTTHRASLELIKGCRVQTQTQRARVRKLMNEVKERIDAVRPSSTPSEHHAPYRSKFDIELPTFNGNPRDWAAYFELFSTTLEKRGSHLTQEERCCLLLKSLKDQEAKELAQLNTSGTDGYDRALQALKQRYGHSQVILPLHVSTILNHQQYDFDRDSLLQIGKNFVTTFDSLNTMEVDLSTFLVAVAASRFKPKLAEEWSKHTMTITGLPTIKDLNDYIQSIVCRLPVLPVTSTNSTSIGSKTKNKQVKTENSINPGTSCILCGNGSHPLSKCSTFKGYNAERRGKFVRDKRWCLNCLHHSHTSQHCPSAFTCRQCNGRHHTLLHRGDPPPTEQPSSTTNNANSCLASSQSSSRAAQRKGNNNNPLTLSFLSTALVNAINGGRQMTSRLALDSGSSTSLITEALASHLKLKRSPHRLTIAGAYGDGSSKSYVEATLQSRVYPGKQITLKLAVVKKLPTATPPSSTTHITSDENVKELQLADDKFGGKLDILLGTCDAHSCVQGHFQHIPSRSLTLTPTIFGWTVSGPLMPGQTSKFLSLQTTTDELQQTLQRLWTLDRTPEIDHHTTNEEDALQQFQNNHRIDSTGRYSVSLPRIQPTPQLGMSRNLAIKRFNSNERSLIKKDKLDIFNESLREYEDLDHAELIPTSEIHLSPSYYLPVHGVFKATSTTTKARPVFDASAKSSNRVALNDILLTGPNLYPLLSDLLIQFREKKIAFSADISKMFREILLNVDERDLHRFLMRDSGGKLNDYRMKRLTFGVRSSPFLATRVLQHLAERHSQSHPVAAEAILRHFYVDDYLSGSDTVEEASHVRQQLCQLLKLAGMNLRKWRTSSQEFANTIPEELLEKENLTLSDAPKALGIHWSTSDDTLQISTPEESSHLNITKRVIASEAAKVFDILGLFSPFVIRSKILLQEAWKIDCGWDEEVTDSIKLKWNEWISELPLIHQHAIDRRYNKNESPIIQKSLHGFSDASNLAYGAVVYLRQLHEDGSINVSLVMSKARVAPLKVITIPRAELVAAHLLARLLTYSAKLLDINSANLHAWTDSMIVLCWIRKAPSSLQTFVANRISQIQQLLSDTSWKHVPTKENPADLLSRGVSAAALLSSSFWWVGPSWLSQTPANWSPQQHLTSSLPKRPPETKAVVMTAIQQVKQHDLWTRFSSFSRLTRILAWIRRFLNNLQSTKQSTKKELSQSLQSQELQAARNFLLRTAQQQSYPELNNIITKGKQLPSKHPLAKLNLSINNDNLIMASGRVRQSGCKDPKKAIVLSLQSSITKLYIHTQHQVNNHPGVSALMAILTENFFITGLKSHLKFLSRSCERCQRAYAQPLQPSMGLLPSSRTTPSPPFQVTGVDFAGPFSLKKGHTRKPVIIKTYLCLFVCFSTRAVHIELCGDLSTEEFISALKRFCARRGTPTDMHSDNGKNFVGAAAEMRQIQHLLNSSRQAISHLSTTTNITWHFIPPRSPNFGGLWEAGVKQVKLLLKKIVSPHPLLYEELYTVLTEVEAVLNSRPITPLDSTELDDDLVLTPGHFLIGRPLRAMARQKASEAKLTSLKRWKLVQRLQQDLWQSWQTWYLNTLSSHSKWKKKSRSLKIGDVVLIKDETLAGPLSWPLARIAQLYPGDDGISRAADLRCQGRIYKRALNRIVPIHQPEDYTTST